MPMPTIAETPPEPVSLDVCQPVPAEVLGRVLQQFNLTRAEYEAIVSQLGRAPNFTELAMFSVLWSEHCCYKNSRPLLKRLPTQGPRVVQGPGENAGVIDVGDGIQVAFKIESHNHPTAVEPYQGAATGVGGILRDIFTMNARPVASLNALRFGPQQASPAHTTPAQAARNRYLLSHAVAGIGGYGNCVGVPTVGGDVFFDPTYTGNPLVNAMAIGVLQGPVMPSRAAGPGNVVLYVGSATGKDGMGGAAFASRELHAGSMEDRPAVQVGDPFAEKLLIESCLEAFATGAVVAAQDMGAAGLTSSSCEMSAKGGVGMTLDLDRVPAREPQMQAHEYLLSESQERMLMVIDRERVGQVCAIFEKWGVPSVVVGHVTAEPMIRIVHQGRTVVDLPAVALADGAPLYHQGEQPPEPEAARQRRTRPPEEELLALSPDDVATWLHALLASDNIHPAKHIFQQYDRHVQNNTLLASENNTPGVIRLRTSSGAWSRQSLAATVDCQPRHVALNPYQGTLGAVAEAARNLACVGAQPLAITNNLNFGNPEKPEIYHQLYYAVEGLKDACTAFETPVTGGNVSLYNEHSGQAILPTPVVGMVGLLSSQDPAHCPTPMMPAFQQAGDAVVLVGCFAPSLGGAEYQVLRTGGAFYGEPPTVDLDAEKRLQALLVSLIQTQRLRSAQDVSLGGLLVTVAECLPPHLGARLDFSSLADVTPRLDTLLFGETHASILLSLPPQQADEVRRQTLAAGLHYHYLGEVTPEPAALALTLPGPATLEFPIVHHHVSP